MALLLPDGINLNKSPINNAAIQVLAAAPSSPVDGQVYKDSTTHALMVYDAYSSTWAPADASKATNIPVAAIPSFASTVKGYSLDMFAYAAAAMNFNGQRLTNVATPTSGSDAATMAWVTSQLQATAAGISGKGSVAVIATTNQSLTYGSFPTIDSYTVTLGERVLLAGQTTASQNGPYIVGASGFTRVTTDANNELQPGSFWLVDAGTVNGGSQWWITSPGPGVTITPGTTNITISKFGAGIAYSAGNGMSLTSGVFAVQAISGGGILVSASGVAVDTTKFTQKMNQQIGNGTATSFTINHNFNNSNPSVTVRDSSGTEIKPDNVATDANNVTVSFYTAPASNAYNVSVQG